MSSMIDRLRDELERHQSVLDTHERRLSHVEVEEERTRRRLHRLENERKAVRLLTETTQGLAEQTRALASQVSHTIGQAEQLAEAAAEKAIAKAAARRAASRWRVAGRLATHMTAVGGFGSLIAFIVAHYS